jgi:two-component system OmpR family sensor kinase
VKIRPQSVRGRIATVFAVGASLVLVTSAAFIYRDLNHELQQTINARLRAEADDVTATGLVQPPGLKDRAVFVLLLDPTGKVIDRSALGPHIGRVLTADETQRALRNEIAVDREVEGVGEPARLLARAANIGGHDVIVVVGVSIATEVRAAQRLALVLAIVSPLLIGVITAGGWLLAGAALRPVARMAQEAAAISLEESGRRLQEPPGDDEIARLGQTLNAMLARIEAAFARERAFVDDASHELRTPISILRAELELALLQPGDRDETQRVLRSALDEAERLSQLAEDLLVLARVDAGTLPVRRENVDVGVILARCADRYAGAGGVQIAVTTAGDMLVHADPARLEQVISNLLANARRHATAHVSIEARRVDDAIELVVADDGPGFPADLLPVALDRFTRGDGARNREGGGAGLGLSIIRTIVGAHGGRVEVANGPPLGGGTVRVRLPMT